MAGNIVMQMIEANGARIPAIGLGTWELRGRTCARARRVRVAMNPSAAQHGRRDTSVHQSVSTSSAAADDSLWPSKVSRRGSRLSTKCL